MRRRFTIAILPLALAAGCSSTETWEADLREARWKQDSAEQAAEQATIDKVRADKELELAQKNNRVLQERLALAYDALREARAKQDVSLHDRLTELSESTTSPGERYEISQYGGIVLESGIFFGSGRHELTSQGKAALTPLVTTLLKDDYKDYEIELAGHTDSDPITRSADRYRDNHDLAAMRANSVRRFLIEQGVPAERVYLSAWGQHRPIGKDKAKDRRVEIMLHKRSTEPSVPASAPRQE